MIREDFLSFDGKNVSLCVWDEVKGEKKGVLLIAHGMAEDVKRYDEFAKFLNLNGFVVAGDDHRAHGITGGVALGHYEGDVFNDTVCDIKAIAAYLNQRYADLPLFLLGHSYGSFLSQGLICEGETDCFKGVVLSGSAFMGGALLGFGAFLARRKVKKGKAKEGGKTFAKLTFETYDKKIKEGKNGWLSFDKDNVEKYNADPNCGFLCSNGFYDSFFRGLKKIEKCDFSNADKSLPILLISGDNDPVGGNGKLVKKLNEHYLKKGLNVKIKLYEKMRHEILNETQKRMVYEDVLEFLEKISLQI